MQNGTFIHGKCDCFKAEPYSALIDSVKMLCDIIALEDTSTRERHCTLLQDAARGEGQLLTNMTNKLENIIGKQLDAFDYFSPEAKIDLTTCL